MNLKVGRGRLGRLLRNLSYWMTVPWGLAYLTALVFFGWIPPGFASGYAITGIILLPSFTLAVLSAISPITLRVRCWKCGFDRDFKGRGNQAHPPGR